MSASRASPTPTAAGAHPTDASSGTTGSRSTNGFGNKARSARGPLPEPFGQHIFGALADLHPLVKRRRIGAAVGSQVIPREQLADFGLDGLADRLEPGRPAVLRCVQVDHRGPGTLPGIRRVDVEVISAGLERIRMRLEFLARRIALALGRFAEVGRQA